MSYAVYLKWVNQHLHHGIQSVVYCDVTAILRGNWFWLPSSLKMASLHVDEV